MQMKDALGLFGESQAARYLAKEGMSVIARRWRCANGEIDIVALDGRTIVICEVKTRRSTRAGSALEAVTPAKVARLRRLAQSWMAVNSRPGNDIRIDVVTVTVSSSGVPTLRHLKAVQ